MKKSPLTREITLIGNVKKNEVQVVKRTNKKKNTRTMTEIRKNAH